MRKPRVGIVGLGGIAQKAYLPILSKEKDWQLMGAFSPGVEKRKQICSQYRMQEYSNLPALASDCDAIFVHSSTASHFEVVAELLNKGIDVYVDKPLASTVAEAEKLVTLSKNKGRKLMVGFNRRFSPMYVEAKKQAKDTSWIRFEKHRARSIGPGSYQFTLLDDYIHVVDTARWLADSELLVKYSEIKVNQDNHLTRAQHIFEAPDGTVLHTAMHRHAGSNLEQLEMQTDGATIRIKNMRLTEIEQQQGRTSIEPSSWDSILKQRGFENAVDHFIQCINHDLQPELDGEEGLKTQMLLDSLLTESHR
ncbi:Gfo/Idh/MocA family protein [Oceanobacillus massiliensis]|uniref:Gfo/Idh/MocA family protein n=1 Tax=Oceanobacillus massiliensis TaxID=1465765 RepID=UPI0002881773|nr:Gfo/Idh/MocA family oxidoreductase [Oceanobacillus massiliensis]